MDSVEIDAIVARLCELENENSRLKILLSEHGISYEEKKQEPITIVSKYEDNNSAMQRLSLQEKVKLFRMLFKGREDVFAKRGIVMSQRNQVINLYASENGIVNFVISGSISVQNAPIAFLYR